MRLTTVMKPSPPSWIIARITTCPNSVHCVQVSTRISPVTQLEEVAVNNPVKKPALCPSREATGRVSSRAPTRMMMAKEAATIRVALRLRPRTNPFRSQRAHRFSTVRSSYVKVKTN